MKFIYPAIFHTENDSVWVEFPDLEGCQTFGYSVSQAMEGAEEALQGYLFALIEDGKKITPPSDIKNIRVDGVSFSSLVSCQVVQNTNSVKKTLTIPGLLNERAISLGINFSQTLQDALIRKIQSV